MIMSPRDNALAVMKAALNAVPVVGGSIASLIGDYVPMSTQLSIERSIELLSQQLRSLTGRLDFESVNKEDFSELFKSCYLVIVRTNREEKLRAATALLANLLLPPGDEAKSSYEELDHLIRCVDSLSIGAISVLRVARDMAVTSGQGAQRRLLFDQLHRAFPGFEASLVMSLLSELSAFNLVRTQEGLVRTPGYDDIAVEVTPIGARLVERFIASESFAQ